MVFFFLPKYIAKINYFALYVCTARLRYYRSFETVPCCLRETSASVTPSLISVTVWSYLSTGNKTIKPQPFNVRGEFPLFRKSL